MPRFPQSSEPRPSCEGCFFGRNRLCALELDAPCATFRPDSPEGLKPQRQLRFTFRVADAEPAPAAPLAAPVAAPVAVAAAAG